MSKANMEKSNKPFILELIQESTKDLLHRWKKPEKQTYKLAS